ncbi:MAG: SpoIIE family protein phosphatase [Desulfobacterales bacterium]|nr:MAG: SpoIIE family protein phosphatase [Desulfobacterales bacterium]
MRFRWKLLVVLLIIALVPIMFMRTLGVRSVRRLAEELIARSRANLIDSAEDRLRFLITTYSQMLWQGREQLEMALLLQAREVEELLARNPSTPLEIYRTHDFQDPLRRPPDLSPSANHFRILGANRVEIMEVAYSTQVFKRVSGVKAEDVAADMARLAAMTPVYQELSKRIRGLVIWHYTVLENGLLSVFPGHGQIPLDFDPRQQLWYTAAFKRQSPWTDQFVDPETGQSVVAVSRPVKGPGGEIAGVTSLIVPISSLLERRVLLENIPTETQPLMVYLEVHPETGARGARIVAREEPSADRPRGWRSSMADDWLVSTDEKQFKAVLDDFELGISNIRRMRYKGCECLWVYGPMHTRGFLVLITPYAELLKPAQQAQAYIQGQIDDLLEVTRYGVAAILPVIMGLALAFSRTVTKPMHILAEGAARLARGHFDTRVNIRSRDEFGEMGRVFNLVGPQLEEHLHMRQALDLAKEVQQNLLPKANPLVDGLDIAGQIVYCEETGGDYYDFIPPAKLKKAELGVVVGDVSGHGISAALLMATARALLRQRTALPGSVEQIVADVNRQLSQDVEDSGQFMTLFYGQVDGRQKKFRWVRAGHEPAMIYDVHTDAFEELGGRGLPLGVFEDAQYEEQQREISPGQIIIIGTDGIWEARNKDGRMFGRESLQRLIRSQAHNSAAQIIQAVTTALEKFRHPLTQKEDDVTLVIIKVDEQKGGDAKGV